MAPFARLKPSRTCAFTAWPPRGATTTATALSQKSAVRSKCKTPKVAASALLWQDFDDDGSLDLYVANDISDNVFCHNTGGKFEDISHPALVADYRSAMGLAAGDYDRDGDDDLFITH